MEDDTALLAGFLGSVLALAGSQRINWLLALTVLLAGCGFSYYGAPLLVAYLDMPDATGLFGFLLGILGIKIFDWLRSLSIKDIIGMIRRD